MIKITIDEMEFIERSKISEIGVKYIRNSV